MPETQNFAFLLVEEFSHLAFSCAVEPLRIANLVSEQDLYSWTILSEDGETATCSNGIVTQVNGGILSIDKCDRLFVLSGINMRAHVTRGLLAALRRERALGTQIGALCSGAWLLAGAGLLTGHSATIHWEELAAFAEAFPEVSVQRERYVIDGDRITGTGAMASFDLMMWLIARDHGEALRQDVAALFMSGDAPGPVSALAARLAWPTMWPSPETRWPTLRLSTLLPISTISPLYSCPTTIGTGMFCWAQPSQL